jgi:hypothetical protein
MAHEDTPRAGVVYYTFTAFSGSQMALAESAPRTTSAGLVVTDWAVVSEEDAVRAGPWMAEVFARPLTRAINATLPAGARRALAPYQNLEDTCCADCARLRPLPPETADRLLWDTCRAQGSTPDQLATAATSMGGGSRVFREGVEAYFRRGCYGPVKSCRGCRIDKCRHNFFDLGSPGQVAGETDLCSACRARGTA